jgi:hypothetical protein
MFEQQTLGAKDQNTIRENAGELQSVSPGRPLTYLLANHWPQAPMEYGHVFADGAFGDIGIRWSFE